MNKTVGIALVCSLTFGIIGCGSRNPNMSPERLVAVYGIRVADTLTQIRLTSETLYTQQVIDKNQYDRVLTALIKANDAGVKLGEALKAYDAATSVQEQNTLAGQIDAGLVTLGVLLPNVLAPINNEEGRAKVGALVGEIQKIALTIARLTAPKQSYVDVPASAVAQ